VKPQGEIRQSQLVTTFGPGSMVDLPDYSVLIAGWTLWTAGGEPISEPRLSRKLAAVLDVPSVDLRTPPPADDDPTAPPRGIVAFQFPEWFIVQGAERARGRQVAHPTVGAQEVVNQRQVHRSRPEETLRCACPVRPRLPCGPHRRYRLVRLRTHNGPSDCAKQVRQLFIDERGTSGDLTEIWVRCECGKAERSMAQAAVLANKALGSCDGARPWLGIYQRDLR
jgi:hypothetical protein